MNNEDKAIIYQAKEGTADIFTAYNKRTQDINLKDYNKVAILNINTNNLSVEEILEEIFTYGNTNVIGNKARSISVSDIIYYNKKYYYVDSFGFIDITKEIDSNKLNEDIDLEMKTAIDNMIAQLINSGMSKQDATETVLYIKDLFFKSIQNKFSINESLDEYAEKVSINDMIDIFNRMRKNGWSGSIEDAELYFKKAFNEKFTNKIEEANEEDSDNFLSDRDKKIFQDLANQPDEPKTTYDYIVDRIGQPMTVGQFNQAMRNIFGRFNEIFLMISQLYNEAGHERNLEILDDDEKYIITIKIIDPVESTLEITDVHVKNIGEE